jgi:tetratricopeptide (TPR) repeat protein
LSELEKILKETNDLRKSKHYTEALNLLEKAYMEHDSSDQLKTSLIDLLFEFGDHKNDELVADYSGAVDVFKRIIQIDPKNYRAHYNLGIAFQNLNQLDEALEAFQTAIGIKPDYYFCYYNIGLVFEEKKDLIKAIEYYEKAMKIEPNFRYAKQAISELREITDRSPERENFSELKSLMLMSTKVRIDLIQEILKISKTDLINLLVKWGEKFNFELDGDYLIINKSTLDGLFNELKTEGLF